MPEIRNPNLQTQGPGGGGGSGSGGDMRVMLGLTLVALLAVTAFQYFKPKPAEPLPAQPAQTQSTPPAPAASGSGPTSPGEKAGAAAAPQLPAITAASETETTVENEWYRITFSNRGGEVKRWILKHYYDSGGVAAGHDLDMVQQEAAARFGYPLSLFKDAGGLIALDRDDRRVVVLLARARETGAGVTVPASALAQAIRRPDRQVRLSRFIRQPTTDVIDLGRVDATSVGRLLAASGTSDIADAHVVISARRADQPVVTSDPGDLRQLDPALRLIAL